METKRRNGALLVAAGAVAAGLLLASCANGSSSAGPLPEKTGMTVPIPTPATKSQGAVAAYRAMWDDLSAAATTSDARHPRLQAHAEGGALELLRYMMTEDHKKGVVTKGQLHLDPVVEKGDATTVTIRDCADASRWLHYTKGGGLQDDVPGGHHRVEASVQHHGEAWRVNRLYIDQVGTC